MIEDWEARGWTSVSSSPIHLTRLWRIMIPWLTSPPRCSCCCSWRLLCWAPSPSGGWWRGRAPSSGQSLCCTPTLSSGQGYTSHVTCLVSCLYNKFSPPGPQPWSCSALTPAGARAWPGQKREVTRHKIWYYTCFRYWDNFILSTPLTAALNLVAALHNDQFYPVAKLSVREAKEWGFPLLMHA